MAISVNITNVKKGLPQLINLIFDSNEEIIILRHGNPVAKLVGLAPPSNKEKRTETERSSTFGNRPNAKSTFPATVSGETLEIQIQNLIVHHTQIEGQKLLLAIWFNRQNIEGNVHLLEVAEGFPDNGLGRLETFTFAPTPHFH